VEKKNVKSAFVAITFFILLAGVSLACDNTCIRFGNIPNNYAGPVGNYLPLGFSFLYALCDQTCIGISSTCSDTDGGLDYFTKGTVSGAFGGMQFTFEDVCLDDVCKTNNCLNSNSLVEWYCEDGKCGLELPKVKIVRCDNGCMEGACIPKEIPEFGTMAALVALLGSAAVFAVVRK
jgi:hypothetical protein